MRELPAEPRVVVRRTTRRTRTVRLYAHRVVRTPEDTIRVWTRRRRSFASGAVAYSGVALVFGGGLVTWLFALAAVLSVAVVIKATVLIAAAERTPRP